MIRKHNQQMETPPCKTDAKPEQVMSSGQQEEKARPRSSKNLDWTVQNPMVTKKNNH